MAYVAQLNYIDGGERCTNNLTYYANLGVNNTRDIETPAAPVYTKPFFSSASWTPNNGFSSSTVYHGVRVFFSNLAGIAALNFVSPNGITQFSVQANPNGSISIVSGTTVLATSPASVVFSQTVFFMEVAASISATTGSVSVYLNGNPTAVLSVSGVNTKSDPGSALVTFFGTSVTGYGQYFLWRDMYCHDGTGSAPFNAPLGDVGVEYLPPAANVSVSFTPNGNAANYENAAQTPPNPTVDFNQSNTVGASDSFSITPLPSNVVEVIAVKAFNYSSKNNTGARAMQNAITSSGTTATGASNYLNETPVVYEDTFVTDPATGASFLPAAVNALVSSYKISA